MLFMAMAFAWESILIISNPELPSFPFKTVAQGAATTVRCTTSPRFKSMGGVYFENCDIAVVIPGVMAMPRDYALGVRCGGR